MQVLVVVDMQNDFIDGALGTEEAIEILQNAADKIKSFNGKVLYTRDTHENNYMDTIEGKNLPVPHCIKGTHGWMIHPLLEELRKESPIDKPTFGSVALGQLLKEMNQCETITSVTLIGLCTDICVISNALVIKAFLPETEILVDASCCAGVTVESHKRALASMKMCHIKIVNEDV